MDAGRDDDIAIVGIGARFPDAVDLDEFLENLRTGRDSVGPMPRERAAATGLGDPAGYVPMGYLRDVHNFDHGFFGLSRREAALMDPQQRIALELANRAIEDAGYDAGQLRTNETAVVFSAPTPGYHGLAVDPGLLGVLGNLGFGTPARIAHLLGLTGPCYAIDSGCNASLIAVHHACREVRSGDADYALAGGVNVRAGGVAAEGPELFGGIASPSGRCRAFDVDADGAASGEGGAALLLTTVARARADRATAYAVIRGSAALHSGHSSATISSPSASAQTRVIEKAWRRAAAAPADAGYLEAHGSGTPLGDAVELEGIMAAFGAERTEPLPVGSVKTNIGHLDHAAGVAGLLEAVLSVAHGQLYESLHFQSPTGGVDLAASGIEIVTNSRPWKHTHAPRLAGVSSFSLGGANAHCVVAQAPDDLTSGRTMAGERSVAVADTLRTIAVSARSDRALVQLCGDLAQALRQGRYDLDDVAFTLGVGRVHYAHRFSVAVADTAELVAALTDRVNRSAEAGAAAVTPAVVLLLAPDVVPSGVVERSLPAHFRASGPVAEVLAAQLAMYDELSSAGLRINGVLSAGASRVAARYLRGSTEPVDPNDCSVTSFSVDRPKLVAAARTLLDSEPVVFVEPGAGGRLSELLHEEIPEADVIAVQRCPSLLAELHQRGVDIDWAAVCSGRGRRVRLPGHPLQAARCWVDLPHAGLSLSQAMPAANSTPATASLSLNLPDPSNPMEWLRATLRDLLHIDSEIDADADYFDMGGNSIIAVQLADRIENAYGFRPALIEVYEHPRLDDFVELLHPRPPSTTRSEVPELVAVDEPMLSFAQERMWFHHQFAPETTLYNYPSVSLVRGGVDVVALRGVFEDLVARHESLRYNVVATDGVPTPRVRAELASFFDVADVSTEPEPIVAARELVRANAQTPFDIAVDPLLRVLVVVLGPKEHVLQITCHHMVTDGATPMILGREVPELYAARTEGRPHRLAPLPFRYRDYAWWQRRMLAGSALDHELDYWIEMLRETPRLELPTDFPRPPHKTFVGDLLPFTVPAELLRALRAVAKRESVSLFVVLLTGLYLLLAQYSGQRDIVVGTPTSGRSRRELHDMIGYFNSTVALRIDLTAEPTVAETLTRVRSVVLGALEHQEIPFDRVVNAVDDQRDTSRTPVFDVLYVHQELPDTTLIAGAGSAGFDVEHSPANAFGGMPPGTAKFDLTLVTYFQPGAPDRDVGACWEFSTELFTKATVERMAHGYTAILEKLAGVDSTVPIAQLIVSGANTGDAISGASEPEPPRAALQIPADRPRPSGQAAHYLAWAVREVAASAAAEVEVLAAWVSLLGWYAGSDEVSLALVADNSDAAVSLVPALFDLSDEPSCVELAARAEAVWAARLGDNDAVSTEPALFDTARFGARPTEPSGTELVLTCGAASVETVVLELGYARQLFDSETAEDMLDDLERLLAAIRSATNESVLEVMAQ